MNLYIFENQARGCNGSVVILAESVEQAVEIAYRDIKEHEEYDGANDGVVFMDDPEFYKAMNTRAYESTWQQSQYERDTLLTVMPSEYTDCYVLARTIDLDTAAPQFVLIEEDRQ